MVEIGSPLGNGQTMSKSEGSPFKSDITGYSILQAEDMKAAKDLLKGHPHLEWGENTSLDVYESFQMPA